MSRPTKKSLVVAGFCASLLVTAAAAADAPPPAAPPLPPMSPPGLFSPMPFSGEALFGPAPVGMPPFGPFPGPHPFAARHERPTPRDLCLDGLAREAAMRGYVEAKLDLTPAQRPLWQHIAEAAQSAAEAQRSLCEKIPASADVRPPTLPQALAMQQEMLAARLAELQQVQPAVNALYEALSPEQRLSLDPPGSPRS